MLHPACDLDSREPLDPELPPKKDYLPRGSALMAANT